MLPKSVTLLLMIIEAVDSKFYAPDVGRNFKSLMNPYGRLYTQAFQRSVDVRLPENIK